ncbi:LuxR C-terminal-related transcriptional regulator [Pseudoduganella sp. UC29_71]|uniref:LuxR C-terminal-related transcriptional regulator n=1 Tax=Pseudoduganella sp. UC29_71 TaxID=3350174 RepID=UPI00366CEE2D
MAAPMATPLIATKTLPPKHRRGLISRARLGGLADDIESHLLTIVKAPGGFGKTTLAQAWAGTLAERGHLVAWLSLDPDDDEPQRFLHYTSHALQRAHPDLGAACVAMFSQSMLADPQQALAMLIEEVVSCGEEVFLFLDDFHCLTLPEIHALVSFLLRYAPSNLHLVLLSRASAPLALDTLRVRHALLEIDAAQLRFTAEETQEFLDASPTDKLSPEDSRRIHSQTEGWAAALRLMSLSLQGQGRRSYPPHAQAPSTAGLARSIDGYLCELLTQLPPELADFMLRTALPERLSPALAVALIGSEAARSQLAQLEQRQLLTALDDEGQWYAYHQLIREHLGQRLQQQGGALAAELHARAAAWYHGQGLWSPAVRHALDGGATAQAYAWIEECAMPLVKAGDILTLVGCERQLAAHLVRPPVRLRIALAWARILACACPDAIKLLDDIEADADSEQLRLDSRAARAAAYALLDRPLEARAIAEDCLRHPVPDRWVHNSLYNILRFCALRTGRWTDFYATPDLPYPEGESRRNILSAIYRLVLLGVGDCVRGKLSLAEQRYTAAISLGYSADNPDSGVTALPSGMLAHVRYEQNRLDEAEALLANRLEVLCTLGFAESVKHIFLTAARMAQRHGRPERALALLEQAENIGISRQWDRLVAAVQLERLRLHLSQGRLAEAQAYLQRLRQLAVATPHTPTNPLGEVRQYAAFGDAYCALQQYRYKDAQQVLEPLLAELLSLDSQLLAVRAGLALAIAQQGQRNHTHALRSCRQAMAMAAEGGIVGSVLDQGPDLGGLLAILRDSLDDATPLHGFTLRVLEAWQALYGGMPNAGGKAPGRAAGPGGAEQRQALGPRECGILELIAEGNSNKEVARLLGIGPETVKTHLKNIFAKLNVDRRIQAVAQAEALGLLKRRR